MEPPIYNPSVPYTGHIVGGFRPGRMIRLQGRISPNANGFTINLMCGSNSNHDDLALHFNPRFHEQAVVRNAKNYSSWGQEERHGTFPFSPGQHFEIMILSEPHQYKIAVNGQHFTEFNHRVPVDRVTCIGIEGDVSVSLIQFEGTAAPAYSPSAPQAPIMSPSGPPMGMVPPPYPVGAGNAPPYPVGAGNAPPYPAGNVYPGPAPPAYGANAYPAPGFNAAGPYPPQQQAGGYPGGYGSCPRSYGYHPPPSSPYQQQPPQYGGYPSSPGHQKSGLLDNPGKLIAGGLTAIGLGAVASKIPGMGGHHGGGHAGYPHGGGHGHGHGGGFPGGAAAGGLLGSAAALGVGGLVAGKAMKKGKKNKLLKLGLPVAGVLGTGYVAHKGMKGMKKGFGHHGHSSSSSSSSSEEE